MARSLPIRLRTIAAAAVVIATGLIIWNAYQSIINTTEPTSQSLPIIKAESEPFRVLPENPGGADIPNKGSRLFNVLNAENADDLALSGVKIDADEEQDEPATLEPTEGNTGFQLPEIPETRRESLYGDIETLKDRKVIEDDSELSPITEEEKEELKEKLQAAIEHVESQPKEKTVEEEVETPVVEAIENDEKETGEVVSNVPVPTKKPELPERAVTKKVEPAAQTTPITSQSAQPASPDRFSVDRILAQEPTRKSHYIQLASLKSEQAARDAYGRIRDQFPDLVRGLSVVFPRADLGSRGIFYRIQIGPLGQSEAKKRCDSYRGAAGGGTCLVVSR